jgi:murein peptide amidase A
VSVRFFLTLGGFLAATFILAAATEKASEKPYLSSGDHARLVTSLTCKIKNADDDEKIQVKKYRFGRSEGKRNLHAYIVAPRKSKKSKPKNIYLIAAQHGDERNSKRVLELFMREVKLLSADYRNDHRIIIIPLYNPDGYKRYDRFAAKKVDLNRDFPSSDGEGNPHSKVTEAFLKLLKRYPATEIYNIHQPFRVVLYYPEDEKVAKPFGQLSDYPLGQGVGYPTPGSLGTYAREKKIPILTVELSRSMRSIMAPFIYEEVRLALFNAAFGCIPKAAIKSRLEKHLKK